LALASIEKLKCPQASHRGHERVKNSMNNKHNSRQATSYNGTVTKTNFMKHDPSDIHATRQEIFTFYVTIRLLTVFIKTHHLNLPRTTFTSAF
jgi:hypothetical protein